VELSVQVAEGEKVPGALAVKVTVPVGAVGTLEVSVIVAVQVVGWPASMDEGLQVTLVEVVSMIRRYTYA